MYDFRYFRTFKSLISLGPFDKPPLSYVECTIVDENHERKNVQQEPYHQAYLS